MEACREARSAARGLGETWALLAELPGKCGCLARDLVIHIDNCKDACGRRAAGRANEAVVCNKSQNSHENSPEKKGSFLKEWGRSIYSLSPALTVSYFNVQGDACMSNAGKPVAPG